MAIFFCAGAPPLYQHTRRGARRHAARQQRWRDRQLNKMTQGGCAPSRPVFTISAAVNMAVLERTDVPPALDNPSKKRVKHNATLSVFPDGSVKYSEYRIGGVRVFPLR